MLRSSRSLCQLTPGLRLLTASAAKVYPCLLSCTDCESFELHARISDTVVQSGSERQVQIFCQRNFSGDRALQNHMNDHRDLMPNFPSSQGLGLELPAWFSFALGGLATLVMIYVVVARPAAQEMARMRQEIRSLEQSISAIAAQKDTVAETNSILALLTEQAQHHLAARDSLNQIQQLHQRLRAESHQLQPAQSTLTGLLSLKDDLIHAADETGEAADAMVDIESLQTRLVETAEMSSEARRASDELLALEQDLICRGYDIDLAREALDDLTMFRELLVENADEVETAYQQVENLVALKDTVLSQTGDLADAIETLELTSDIYDQFQAAANSFRHVRTWLVEVVMLEPMLQRAMQSLQPLTELGNLRRLSGDQLRAVARSINDRQRTHLAQKPMASRDIAEVDSPDEFSVLLDDAAKTR